MEMILRFWGVGACALALALVTTACAPDPGGLNPPERDRGVQPGEDVELTERLHLPIYDYRTDEAQIRAITQATGIHVESCMRDLGYDFTNVPEPEAHVETNTAFFGPHGEYRRYGLVSLDSAAEYGFGVPEHLDPDEDEASLPWSIGHSGQTEQDALDALFGDREDISTPSGEPVPEHGCAGWAQIQVDPDTVFVSKEEAQAGVVAEQPGLAGAAEWIKATSFEQMLDQPEVIDAMTEWAACLDRAGYPGEDFWLVGSAESSVATDDSTAAVAAVECKEETGLIDLMVDVETEIQADLIAEHEAELLERHSQLQEVAEQALASLEEHA